MSSDNIFVAILTLVVGIPYFLLLVYIFLEAKDISNKGGK